MKNYFENSLEKNYDTVEMSKMIFLTIDLAGPGLEYNISGVAENEEFFMKELTESGMISKYDSQVNKIIDKMQLGQPMTLEEFERYDEIFYEYSYRTVIQDSDNINVIRTLEKRSKELQVRSKTIENQIEIYILIDV